MSLPDHIASLTDLATGKVLFRKMQGCGNHFIVTGSARNPEKVFKTQEIAAACSMHFGVGADGFLVLSPSLESDRFDAEVSMFNPDGSIMGMCGNGIRCIARFFHENTPVSQRKPHYTFRVHGRTIKTEIRSEGVEGSSSYEVEVGMGKYSLQLASLPAVINGKSGQETVVGSTVPELGSILDTPCTLVSMGNPHTIFFVPSDQLDTVPLEKLGKEIEQHAIFPERTNVEFVSVLDRNRIRMRVWERSAGATLACGTGACACAVAVLINGLSEADVEVQLPGGLVSVSIDTTSHEVSLKGPAENVFDGEIFFSL